LENDCLIIKNAGYSALELTNPAFLMAHYRARRFYRLEYAVFRFKFVSFEMILALRRIPVG
jgi:hypothetical protein